MDPDVLAAVRRAAGDLERVVADLEDEPASWEGRTRLLLRLERVASELVAAARRYAEHLSADAGGQAPAPPP